MKKILLILLLAAPVFATGKYEFKDPKLNDEWDNNYKEHRYPNWVNARGSSATITYINVSTITVSGTQVFGRLIQIVTATNATSASTTSTTLGDTGLTASITPTSTSSKILVMIVIPTRSVGTANQIPLIHLAILRGSTNILDWNDVAAVDQNLAANLHSSVSLVTLDSPASTSALTYKAQYARSTDAGGGTVFVQNLNQTSTIVLMEIK